MKERTLFIVKPDTVAKNQIGDILAMVEKINLSVVAAKMMHLTKEQGQGFYAVHKGKFFYDELVDFISSGPCLLCVLEGDGAILKTRDLMGATDPKKALPGTIRAKFGADISNNACHGSDAPETAKFEIGFFFKPEEILKRVR